MAKEASLLRRPGAIVFVIALFLRLLFLREWSQSPFFVPVSGGNDRSLYDSVARAVAGGEFFPAGVLQHMPLYGWFLGAIYAVSGKAALSAAGLAGCLIDSATAALIVVLARSLGAAAAAAMAAGGLYALYPLAIAYASMTMPNTLNACLFLLVSGGLPQLASERRLSAWLLCGCVAGVAALGFAGMLLVVMFGLPVLVCTGWRRKSMAPLGPLAFLAGVALPLVPVAIHNTRAEGDFVLITAHGGFNFYMGNHEGATGYPVQIAGFRGDQGSLLADARRQAASEKGELSASGFSKYWSDKAWSFIRSHPAAEARLLAGKLAKFWNRAEYDDMRLLPMVRLAGLAFTSPFWPGYGFIAFLGLLGLLVTRDHAVLKAVTFAGMVSLVMFFITSRYRLTFAPVLCVFGAMALTQLAETARRLSATSGGKGSAFAALGVAAIAAAVVLWPTPQSDFRALDRYNVAAHLLERGMAEEALAQAAAGLEVDSTQADLHFVKGNALFGLGRLGEARAAYGEAVGLRPSHADARFNLAVTLKALGKPGEALREAEAASRLDPLHKRARALADELRAEVAPSPAGPVPGSP